MTNLTGDAKGSHVPPIALVPSCIPMEDPICFQISAPSRFGVDGLGISIMKTGRGSWMATQGAEDIKYKELHTEECLVRCPGHLVDGEGHP